MQGAAVNRALGSRIVDAIGIEVRGLRASNSSLASLVDGTSLVARWLFRDGLAAGPRLSKNIYGAQIDFGVKRVYPKR